MRATILLALGVLLLTVPVCSRAQQQTSVAEAARKVREQKKQQPQKPVKVFTNDDLASLSAGISVVGKEASPGQAAATDTKGATPADKVIAAADKGKDDVKGEAYWRKRFAEARDKVKNAAKELDILQREFNLMQQQYYSDPNKALREQYDRKGLNEQETKIDAKKQELAKLRQAVSDLEDDLRRAGGDPGWAREP